MIPWDEPQLISTHICKTKDVGNHGNLFGGVMLSWLDEAGAALAAQIADTGFEFLDAPVKRVASKDVHIAYSPNLENEILVQTDWIEKEIEEILKY